MILRNMACKANFSPRAAMPVLSPTIQVYESFAALRKLADNAPIVLGPAILYPLDNIKGPATHQACAS